MYLHLIIDRDKIHKHYWLIGTDYLGSFTFIYHRIRYNKLIYSNEIEMQLMNL